MVRCLQVLAAAALVSWPSLRTSTDSPHLLLGNPSGARPNSADRDNYLMCKPAFALSYNSSKGTPNWVSWRVVREDLGDSRRVPFYPDEELPRGFRRVQPRDYSGSGFDRGHMCPHSDRGTSELTAYTFAMTNIVPQSPALNQKAWNMFEIYCRELVARQGKRLYVITGPAGRGGSGNQGFAEIIGRGTRVVVPAKCWKIAVVLDGHTPPGPEDIERITKRTRVIALVMPNNQEVGFAWAHTRTSVKKIEELTGLHFFDRLPAGVAEALKEKVDDFHIPHMNPPHHGR